MPRRSGHKRPNEDISSEEAPANFTTDHDYIYEGGMECAVQSSLEEEFPALPITPSKPPLPKKPTFVSNPSKEKGVNSDEVVRTLTVLINNRSDALEKIMESMSVDIKMLSEKVGHIEKRVSRNEDVALKTTNRVSDLERYNRRGNLRLQGLEEDKDEDIRARATNICQAVLPGETSLPAAIDVVHRLGKRLEGSKPRCVFIRFTSRKIRDAIWKAAKKNPYLQNNGLRFTEDLIQEDRENRKKLWPHIKRARDEGKTAYFIGGKGFVNGSEILF